MNSEDFRKAGGEVLDYLADYRESISERFVISNEKPGYMRAYLPNKAPENGEKWEDVMQDLENILVPGFTHWLHPYFHAYFPNGCSYPSILGTMLSSAIACTQSSWSTCPAATELEMIILDWLTRLFDLPRKFLFYEEGSKGGGCLQGSASECCLTILYAARRIALGKLKEENPSEDEGVLLASLTAYCSKEAHSSVEKACLIAMVNLRILDTDERYKFRGSTLQKAIDKDIEDGNHPFFVAATLGTTGCAACDRFDEIGLVAKKYGLWFHMDCAYGGAALVCPELRYLAKGVEYASSLATNPNKWLLTNFDCSAMWVYDRVKFVNALSVDPTSIKEYPGTPIIDNCHWGTTDSRRFRCIKLWFTLRSYGVDGLQKYIRNHVKIAKHFADLVNGDSRFEVMNDVDLGNVCFRLKASNDINAKLLKAITASRKLFMVPTSLAGKYVIRYNVNYDQATENHANYAWAVITHVVDELGLSSETQSTTKKK